MANRFFEMKIMLKNRLTIFTATFLVTLIFLISSAKSESKMRENKDETSNNSRSTAINDYRLRSYTN